eukprot:SM000119S25647  [mRNA]  locus=s119:243862:244401:+ [translate_table: standard]
MNEEIFGADHATKHLRNASAVEINGIVRNVCEACMKSLIYEARCRLVDSVEGMNGINRAREA